MLYYEDMLATVEESWKDLQRLDYQFQEWDLLDSLVEEVIIEKKPKQSTIIPEQRKQPESTPPMPVVQAQVMPPATEVKPLGIGVSTSQTAFTK